MPTISVLTSCYNAERFISGAIESVLGQSYTDFEYVIINDGSTDGTSSILRAYASKDSRIVLYEKENTGLADSLNTGMKLCKTKWVARLDADDIAMPDRLSAQLDFMQNNKGISLLGGGCFLINADGESLGEYHYPLQHESLMARLEKGGAFFPHSSTFFDRMQIVELGGYNFRFTRSQDWDLWLRVGTSTRISCLDRTVIKLRKHANTLSNSDHGKEQSVMGLSARICYFRRKLGVSDPSQQSPETWTSFTKWVEEEARQG
ncbi:MAG: glycosyltransferase, partial [Planctomycetes bacterium]|nr:glycosyltransferase [Planctomycetota bacterium]